MNKNNNTSSYKKDPVLHRIRSRRIEMNLSQEKLGILIKQDQSYISRIETGKHNPSPEDYRLLAIALKVKPEYFFGVEEHTVYALDPRVDRLLDYVISTFINKP